ncbi:MAG TPA: cytochrome C oxidase subunit IV family protein [Polyangia bacterium]|jgi:heme/copper-type cytochrome/quinol oxidase subunit 4
MTADEDVLPSTLSVPKPGRGGRLVLGLCGLLVLTALEVLVVGLPVDRTARITALVGLAMAKALVVLVAFMGIGRESRLLRLALLAPLLLAPAFAVALMLDTAFRVTQR